MTQTVYIDVLFVVNLYVNALLLHSTARFARLRLQKWRILGGAGLGALYCLMIFFPEIHFLLAALCKLIFSATIIWVTFGRLTRGQFIKALACFYAMNFAFAGIMIALWLFLAPRGMLVNNGVVYFNISPLLLVGATAVSYGIVTLIGRLTRRRAPDELIYDVTVEADGVTSTLRGLVDTGNHLSEVISEKPVLLAEYRGVEKLIPTPVRPIFQSMTANPAAQDALQENPWKLRFRVIPYASVGGEGLLPAFAPDRITIRCGGQAVDTRDAFVAVSGKELANGEYNALINPDLIP